GGISPRVGQPLNVPVPVIAVGRGVAARVRVGKYLILVVVREASRFVEGRGDGLQATDLVIGERGGLGRRRPMRAGFEVERGVIRKAFERARAAGGWVANRGKQTRGIVGGAPGTAERVGDGNRTAEAVEPYVPDLADGIGKLLELVELSVIVLVGIGGGVKT